MKNKSEIAASRHPPNQAEDPLILTIDIGPTFIRAASLDRLARAVEGAKAREAHKINLTAEGASEAPTRKESLIL